MTFVALVSDTHGLLRPEVADALAGAERILHMGDVGTPAVLAALEAIAPVTAIRGNVDHGAVAAGLPETTTVEVYGKTAYLIHDRARLDIDPVAAGVDLVLFGHTHKPHREERDGVLYVNPGSIGPRRFTLPVSWARLRPGGEVEFLEI